MMCQKCGQENDAQARFCRACGTALDDLRFPGRSTVHMEEEYAGFWMRVGASVIDSILTTVATFIVAFFFGAMLGLSGGNEEGAEVLGFFIGILVPWIYSAVMESSSRQATVGKAVLGIVVTDLEGKPISFGKATGRYFGKIVSALILGIGFAMAGFTPKKQALHDMMAGCLVVKRP